MQGTFPLQMPNHFQAPLQRKLFTQVSPLLVRELDLNNDVGGAHHLVWTTHLKAQAAFLFFPNRFGCFLSLSFSLSFSFFPFSVLTQTRAHTHTPTHAAHKRTCAHGFTRSNDLKVCKKESFMFSSWFRCADIGMCKRQMRRWVKTRLPPAHFLGNDAWSYAVRYLERHPKSGEIDRPLDFELHPDFEEHQRASKGERKKNWERWRKRGRARESEGRKAKERNRNIERTRGKKR